HHPHLHSFPTRRSSDLKYSSLLIAATNPPVGRMNTLSRLGEMLVFDDDAAHPHELAVNQFRDNVHPRGERYLRRFDLDHTATWRSEEHTSELQSRSDLV